MVLFGGRTAMFGSRVWLYRLPDGRTAMEALNFFRTPRKWTYVFVAWYFGRIRHFGRTVEVMVVRALGGMAFLLYGQGKLDGGPLRHGQAWATHIGSWSG